MDNGLVLRADIYRPPREGQYPVVLSYGPYTKGLAFQEGRPRTLKIVSPSPLIGEDGGEGESKPLPLTSILSRRGEGKFSVVFPEEVD